MEKLATMLTYWSRFSSVPGDIQNVTTYLPAAVAEAARQYSETLAQHRRTTEDAARGPLIVLVHGTGAAPWQWTVARSYLRAAKLTRVFAPVYESRNCIDDSFQTVWDQVVQKVRDQANVVIIGHSQGGLLARMIYEQAKAEFPETRFKVFVLHAPQHGTKAAGMWNDLLASLGMRTRVKPSMKDMEKNSDFVNRYRKMCEQAAEDDPNVFEAAGSQDYVQPSEVFSCASEGNRFTGDYSHYSPMVDKRLWNEFIIPNIVPDSRERLYSAADVKNGTLTAVSDSMPDVDSSSSAS